MKIDGYHQTDLVGVVGHRLDALVKTCFSELASFVFVDHFHTQFRADARHVRARACSSVDQLDFFVAARARRAARARVGISTVCTAYVRGKIFCPLAQQTSNTPQQTTSKATLCNKLQSI